MGEWVKKSTVDHGRAAERVGAMIEGLNRQPDEACLELRQTRSIDRSCRSQIAMAARFLRSIRPQDGDVEIMLHEIARRLEQVVDTGEACRSPPTAAGDRAVPAPRLD